MGEYEKKNREAINKLIENNNLLVKHNQDLVNKFTALETELKLLKAEVIAKPKEPTPEKKPEVVAPVEPPKPDAVAPTAPVAVTPVATQNPVTPIVAPTPAPVDTPKVV